jgi:hypothetical protein
MLVSKKASVEVLYPGATHELTDRAVRPNSFEILGNERLDERGL